ncbi:MAG: acyl-CoA thioesterase [Candidatus Saccharibacteria bacterium]
MEAKPASFSTVTMSQIVLPSMANAAGNMHGGEVMKLMDSAAGVAAQRHSLCQVVTASVTQLTFREPIFVGDLIICKAEIIYTGQTSMQVYVSVEIENLSRGEIKHGLDGYFVMVALDRNGRPVNVPPLLIENEEQQARFEKAKLIIAEMKKVTSL